MGSIEYIGSAYGGWHIRTDLVDNDDTIISAGIGNDTSFDLEMIIRKNCFVVMVDPNHVAIEHTAKLDLAKDKYVHITSALTDQSGVIEFGAERSNGAGVYSPGRKFTVVSITLHQLLSLYKDVSLVKMDIEGAEYGVLWGYDFRIKPKQIAVGYHTNKIGIEHLSINQVDSHICSHGYKVAYTRKEDNEEIVLYVRRDLI